MKEVHLVYFSPALSTKKTLRVIAKGLGLPTKEHDITQGLTEPLNFNSDDFVVFGMPVYAGRISSLAVNTFQKIKGDKTPAIIVCVYGNRDYDDALLELKDISEAKGFIPVAAGAFIARHSIFPRVAEARPDEDDKQELIDFGKRCMQIYNSLDGSVEGISLKVKGNSPYKEPSRIPFTPTGNSSCDNCGTCAEMCPVYAIPADNPRKTDKKLCISCARCITVCPKHSRQFRGLLYTIVRRKFESKYKERKESEAFFLEK